ncbi:flagellar hook-length control protein FliK [Clostridium bowmanii]|uniref:flagellar hook-length control protein FliK n=1 Tax=Clostridium bowmanii TaxID=132925 RepID=UPI001C0AE38E|nr:flagellar hook-length control protein FliK [Clostridium bowmanii]MBU3190582.1 flagellar hook-length control protein FliK [Clostridium bowmanii]MCA1075113.1 flagellar hook-length control protein FliK [Clostridium bowmanii]
MNVNMNVNVNTYASSKKQELSNGNKSEEFKKVLDNHELNSKNSSKKNVQKEQSKDQNLNEADNENKSANVKNKDIENSDVDKTAVEVAPVKDLDNSEDNKELKTKVINFIKEAIDKLKKTVEDASKELDGTDKSGPQMDQIQQLLQLLNSMLQNDPKSSTTIQPESELNSNNLDSLKVGDKLISAEQLIVGEQLKGNEQLNGEEQLMSNPKNNLIKNTLSEIVAMMEQSKVNNIKPSEMTDVIQKLTTVVNDLKENLSLLKVPSLQVLSGNSKDSLTKDNLMNKVMELCTKTTSETLAKSQIQSSNDSSKENKSSGNSSSEEKFLKNLLSGDKDESKISKAVNFMNQFEATKTIDTSKVQTTNLVIDKNDFTLDVIKNIKFMEINNLKDLTVKMNPKELGEITIKLTMESGIMKASISAQNKETFNLLNQNFQDISDRLKSMDIKIQSLDINIYEDSTFFNKDSNGKNSNEGKDNNSDTKMVLEDGNDDMSVISNYAIQENQVNKFV